LQDQIYRLGATQVYASVRLSACPFVCPFVRYYSFLLVPQLFTFEDETFPKVLIILQKDY